jgi:hypothetical protein
MSTRPNPVVTAPCGCLVLDDEWCRRCGGCRPRGDEWAGCCTCDPPSDDEGAVKAQPPLAREGTTHDACVEGWLDTVEEVVAQALQRPDVRTEVTLCRDTPPMVILRSSDGRVVCDLSPGMNVSSRLLLVALVRAVNAA